MKNNLSSELVDILKELINSSQLHLDCTDGSEKQTLQESIWKAQYFLGEHEQAILTDPTPPKIGEKKCIDKEAIEGIVLHKLSKLSSKYQLTFHTNHCIELAADVSSSIMPHIPSNQHPSKEMQAILKKALNLIDIAFAQGWNKGRSKIIWSDTARGQFLQEWGKDITEIRQFAYFEYLKSEVAKNKDADAETTNEVKQAFLNAFDCYADADNVVPAITEEKFIEVVCKVLNFGGIKRHYHQALTNVDELNRKCKELIHTSNSLSSELDVSDKALKFVLNNTEIPLPISYAIKKILGGSTDAKSVNLVEITEEEQMANRNSAYKFFERPSDIDTIAIYTHEEVMNIVRSINDDTRGYDNRSYLNSEFHKLKISKLKTYEEAKEADAALASQRQNESSAWLRLWHEVEMWYSLRRENEPLNQFISRMQKRFYLSEKSISK